MKNIYHQDDCPAIQKKNGQSPLQLKEDKSIILYVLNKIKVGSSRELLSDIILRNIQLNYFILQSYIDDLIKERYILESLDHDGRKVLILSNEGKETIETIAKEIPSYIRELIDLFFEKNQGKIRNRVTVTAEYHTISPGNFVAVLSLSENDLHLIELKINTPTKEDAISLCKKWKLNYQQIYASIIQSFV